MMAFAPGPRGHVLFGCAQQFRERPLALLDECRQRHGPLVRLPVGFGMAFCLAFDPHDLATIFHSDNFGRSDIAKAFEPLAGGSMIIADGDQWKEQRKAVMPSFALPRLRALAQVVDDLAAERVAGWQQHLQAGTPLDLQAQMVAYADLGLSLFQGPAREPYGGRQAEPHGDPYARVQRAAFDGQVTLGPWLLKLEALLQESERGSDQAAVAGFEYTWPSAFGGASDLSLLMEHLVDSRCDSLVAACGEMLGVRWLANDSEDSNLLVSAVRDSPSGRLGLKIQGSRRIDEQLSMLLNSGGMHRARYLSIGLSYAF